tara:strand:+ start:239 stop:640 length:402 start_codon:yes stop_codon:yes gene_type:complete
MMKKQYQQLNKLYLSMIHCRKNRLKNKPTLLPRFKVHFTKQELFECWDKYIELKGSAVCAISNLPMTWERPKNYPKHKWVPSAISVDKLDPLRPYTLENIIFVRSDVNARKCNITYNDCKKIIQLYKERFPGI